MADDGGPVRAARLVEIMRQMGEGDDGSHVARHRLDQLRMYL
jgi:hypothetical protein